jgi:hypothetical protein
MEIRTGCHVNAKPFANEFNAAASAKLRHLEFSRNVGRGLLGEPLLLQVLTHTSSAQTLLCNGKQTGNHMLVVMFSYCMPVAVKATELIDKIRKLGLPKGIGLAVA